MMFAVAGTVASVMTERTCLGVDEEDCDCLFLSWRT